MYASVLKVCATEEAFNGIKAGLPEELKSLEAFQ